MSFNIITYNATNLCGRPRRAEVNHLINKERANIILLQETHLMDKHSLFLSGMKVVRTDDGVGTAVGVKCNIKFEKVYISLLYINYTAVCVKREEGSVLIVSIYVPCGINSGQLNKDLQTIRDVAEKYDETVLGGDWNAHHSMWKSGGVENRAGVAVARILTECTELVLLHTMSHTFRGRTTLDFFITSRGIIRKGHTLEVGPAMPDHSAVILKIDGGGIMAQERKSVFVYKDVDWDVFREVATHELLEVDVPRTRNLRNAEIDAIIELAAAKVRNAMEKCIRKRVVKVNDTEPLPEDVVAEKECDQREVESQTRGKCRMGQCVE